MTCRILQSSPMSCAAADVLADLYGTVGMDQWARPGTRSDGLRFTIESFGRYFVHDLVHHIVDVQRASRCCMMTPDTKYGGCRDKWACAWAIRPIWAPNGCAYDRE
jgi:hypothetical protein